MDRFPWLLCNVGGGLMCAFIASNYERLLERRRRPGAVHPGRARAGRERQHPVGDADAAEPADGPVQWRVLFRSLAQEAVTALMLGLSCGALVGLTAWAWQRASCVAAC